LIDKDIFEDLFVLEMANNHLGSVERGLKIIQEFSQIVRFNNVRASIKLQFRDVGNFVHKDFVERVDLRYVKKTLDTRLSDDQYATLVKAIRQAGCGSSLKDMDDIVTFFANRSIPLAINHCVSIYPSQDSELEINQIDFLRNRYPNNTIGYSTHECTDWNNSMMIAYAKGARTFERHVDINSDGVKVSPYCSLPHQIDEWFKAFHKAKEMCGAPGTQKRMPPKKEIEYLDALVRGVYAKEDLQEGHSLTDEDVYLAIPLQKGQLSCRELMSGEMLMRAVKKDQAIHIDDIDSPYAQIPSLRKTICDRGLDVS